MTIYLDLTREFNADRLRAVICSGQAAVSLLEAHARMVARAEGILPRRLPA